MRKKLIDSLYEHGHSVILLDEQKKGKDGKILSSLDMILDDTAMDIRSITMVKQYHYIAIKINSIQSYAVIRELITGECHLYSIVEKLRQKNDN